MALFALSVLSHFGSLISERDHAEVVFVPNKLCTSKHDPDYRFIVTREEIRSTDPPELRQMLLFDEEFGDHPISSVHPTVMNGKLYKVFALVTNLEWSAVEIVRWHRKRCGKSEELHRILKDELAGGHVVTKALGANAAWWQTPISGMKKTKPRWPVAVPGVKLCLHK